MISLDQAAAHLSMSREWVRREVVAGRLRAHKLGARWRIDEADLARWLDAHANAPADHRRRRRRT
ncbi:MAG TPA: helix-turn-helix domain-containing protein [Nocardioides sp.]|nr:helix-turn-helix domain-containing protein [Nocardioides sp.]